MSASITAGGGRRLWAAVLVALAMLAAAPAADALIVRAPHGRHMGIVPRARTLGPGGAPARAGGHRRGHRHSGRVGSVKSGAHAQPAAPLARAAVVSPGNPLVYHAGGPVLGAHQTYAIYWDPSGQQPFAAGFQSTVGQFLTDVGADSGGHQNVYSVAARYGADGQTGMYSSAYTQALNDTNVYPLDQQRGNSSGCMHGTAKPGDPAYSYCLTDAQIQAELLGLITQNHWPTGGNAVYFVFLPAGVDTCAGPGAQGAGNECADTDFCAYHAATGAQPTPTSDIYSVIPYGSISGCRSSQSPNGGGSHNPADDAINLVSHEHAEAITDPLLSSWYDVNGNEIGDKCAFDFGAAVGGAAPSQYNQVIAGHQYYLQQEWSNAASACIQRDIAAQFSMMPNGSNSGSYSFDAASSQPAGAITSYAWDFGDGSTASGVSTTHTYALGGTYTATLTVTDSAGDTTSLSRTVSLANVGAAFTVSYPGYVNQPIHFDGSASNEPTGAIVSWTWNFGDGSSPTIASDPTMTHFYMRPGSYSVTLTVTDTSGSTATVTHQVIINAPISVTTQSPETGPTFGPGFTHATGTVGPVRFAGVDLSRVGSAQLVISHGRLLLLTGRAMTCRIPAARCTVTVTVTARELATTAGGRHPTVRNVAIATATLSAAPGGRALIRLRLNRHGSALLHRLHRVAVSLDLRAQADRGQQVRQSLRTVIALPRAHAARRTRA